MLKEHTLLKFDFNEYQNILSLNVSKNGQRFFTKSALNSSRNSEKTDGSLGIGQWLGRILFKKQG